MKQTQRLQLLLLSVALLVFSACQTLKNVPEGEFLLDRVEVRAEDRPSDIPKDELTRYIHQQPNGQIFFMRFHLWLYNLGKKGKETGVSGWLHRIGEPPVIYSPALTEQSVGNLQIYLKGRGFYSAEVVDTAYTRRRGRMTVRYTVRFGTPTLVDSVALRIPDSLANSYVERQWANSQLKPGMRLDNLVLEAERSRVEGSLRNAGFYNFSADAIGFVADTLGRGNQATLTLCIPPPNATEFSDRVLRRYVIDSINIYPKAASNRSTSAVDSTWHVRTLGRVRYLYPSTPGIRLPVVARMLRLQPDSILRLSDVNRTQSNLLSLSLYRQAQFEFREQQFTGWRSQADSLNRLYPITCNVLLHRMPVQNYQAGLMLTTSGAIGAEGSLTYTHRNLFYGAELFELRGQASVEALRKRQGLYFKTAMELGLRATLTFPQFLFVYGLNKFEQRYMPSTRLQVSWNYQRRPDYNRTLFTGGITYAWNAGQGSSYSLTPVEVNVVKIFRIDPAFYARISRSYLAHSYISQLVSITGLNYGYQEQSSGNRLSTSTLRASVEASGNTLWAFSKLLKRKRRDGAYTVFDLPFSQFVRADLNYANKVRVDKSNAVVFRVLMGVGYPYANSEALPIEKQYYEGGANGVRAWQARDLGPGSYRDTEFAYPNQTGDIKLEANLEYRFSLFWKLEGALFVDAGNIWAISRRDLREGAIFHFSSFYKQVAVGYGVGVRMNLGFFVLRIDSGFRLYDPYVAPNSGRTRGQFLFAERQFTTDDFVLHFGVGYPF